MLDIIHLDICMRQNMLQKLYIIIIHFLSQGNILVDDISCLQYLKGTKKNSFGNNANQETFEIIQEIFFLIRKILILAILL